MANMQLQRQRTVNTTAISQLQSQEVVQMMIHGALSSLSYLREMFPEKAYALRKFGVDDDNPSYEDFAAARLPDYDPGNTMPGTTNVRLLQRGKSRRVDKFLDWEKDAFSAIERGNLQALQVFIHADTNDRRRVVEAYTFTVRYFRAADDRHIPIGVEFASNESDTLAVGATSHALQTAFREAIDCGESLPRLPAKRYISMTMTYNRHDREPEGWGAAGAEGFLLGDAEGWSPHDEAVAGVFSRFYDTQLKISYLQQNLQRGLPVLDTPMIPERLDYTNERTLPDASDQGPASGAAAMDGISNVFEETQFPEQSLDTPTELSVQTVPTQILPRHGDPASQLDVLQQVVDPSSASPSSDRSPKSHDQQLHESPPRNVAEMRAAFPAMMQPEEFTQGDTQTQEPFHQHHPAASETTASPSRAAASPTAKSDYDMETSRPNLELSQATTARLEQERIGRRPRTRSRSKPAQRKSQDAVACQCGCTEEDDDMIECDFCNTWQHLHCYGFTGSEDVRLPPKHVCYRCLLHGPEQQTFVRLHELVQKRRVMQFLLKTGSKKPSDVAVALQLTVPTAESIVDHLHREGFVAAARGGKRKSSSKFTYTAVKDGPSYEKMKRDLFDPLHLISHHYQTPHTAEEPSFAFSAADESAIQMPPPKTPASRLRNRTARNSSNVGLRKLRLPSSSPTGVSAFSLCGTKRTIGAFVAEAEDSRRVKRVQTQCLLDASALSSSPAGSAHG